MTREPNIPGSLDIREGQPAGPSGGAAGGARPFLMVYFRCSNHYQRVYREADGMRYLARCPSCMKCVRFVVGPGGSADRSFEVSC